jgi:hypothetical protein
MHADFIENQHKSACQTDKKRGVIKDIAIACLSALIGILTLLPSQLAIAADAAACNSAASNACYFSFQPDDSQGNFHYYASHSPNTGVAHAAFKPQSALIALHGHPRDANKTFDAALQAVKNAGALDKVLVVAPLFQVGANKAERCHTAGVPEAQPGDLLWTCGSWIEGGIATNANGTDLTSFGAMDALVQELIRRWPSLRSITIAGFSAGAQMVQHYVGFAAPLAAGAPAIRYVISNPGSWLYFDPVRAQPMLSGINATWTQCVGGDNGMGACTFSLQAAPTDICSDVDRWKYGVHDLPAWLKEKHIAANARARYAHADISYVEGALDSNASRGTFNPILDHSCAAEAQGPFRLQRGLAYAYYDRMMLAPARQRTVTVVPGCAHDVACVFPSKAARSALLGPDY